MKYLFIGSNYFSRKCLEGMQELNLDVTVMSQINMGGEDWCKLDGREFWKIEYEEHYIKSVKPDIICVFGLSQMIPKSILAIPKHGCLGTHPTLLPIGRGHHPIIWAFIKKLKKTGVTFFWLDELVDHGDIWRQEEVALVGGSVKTLYWDVAYRAKDMVKKHMPELEKGNITGTPQDHAKATYWHKRGEEKDAWIKYLL